MLVALCKEVQDLGLILLYDLDDCLVKRPIDKMWLLRSYFNMLSLQMSTKTRLQCAGLQGNHNAPISTFNSGNCAFGVEGQT